MEYENNYISIVELCRIYEISYDSFYKWRKPYEKQGIEGLKESKTFIKFFIISHYNLLEKTGKLFLFNQNN